MGDSAFVLVYGNFEASNQVNIAVSSYLIIQGNFIRNSGSNQAELDITNGNIYVLGTVDGWPDDFTTCDDYDGTTDNNTTEDCDFGTEDDLEDNIDSFPPEYKEKMECYNIQGPEDMTVCAGTTTVFTVTSSNTSVIYKWQFKAPGDMEYTDIGTDSSSLTLSGITPAMSGNLYRVVVKAIDNTAPGCKITISDPAVLEINTNREWTGNVDSNWNIAGNWLCNNIPDLNSDVVIPSGLANYPILEMGSPGKVRNLYIENAASIGIEENTLEIAGNIDASGIIDAQTGGISFVGSSQQDMPQNLLLNNRIKNIEVKNPNGLILKELIELTGTLKLTSGNLSLNNELTLISSVTQTALIDGSGNGEIIGNINMQRFIDPAFGYKYFSTPFSNSSVGDFSAFIDLNSEFPLFYRYNENRKDSQNRDVSGWEAYTDASSGLNIMEGYAINFGDSGVPVWVQLTGKVNNGSIQQNLIHHNGEYTKGFHLVGNPYPSPIDWDAPNGWTRNNIDNAAYFFSADGIDKYTGTYSSYVNGVPSNPGKSSAIIASMQGFFVHVSDPSTGIYPASGTLGMTNEVRVNNFDQEFVKSSESEKQLIRFSASFKNGITDDVVLYFDPYSSPSFEKEKDALKLRNTNINVPNIYFISPGKEELSISAIPGLNNKFSEKIPVGMQVEKSGKISIGIRDLMNLHENFSVYLIDGQKRIATNLTEKDYSFQIDKGKYNSRFYIAFSVNSDLKQVIPTEDPFSLMSGPAEIGIRMKLPENENGLLRVSTINGKLLEVRKVKGEEEIRIKGIKSNGVYLVSYMSGKKQFSKKVIVRK